MNIEPGLLLDRKNHHRFEIVSRELLRDMIASIPPCDNGDIVRVDTKLKDSHDLVNYYLPVGIMPLFRFLGCNTPQVAYTSQGTSFVHWALIRLYHDKNAVGAFKNPSK